MQTGNNLNGKRKSIFVTGATNGTGYAIADRFASEGYTVFIGSRDKKAAETAAQNLNKKRGVPTHGYGTKIFDEKNVREIFADIRDQGYLLDTLVLNAANLAIGQVSLDVNMADFMQVFETNIGWNFMLAREAAKQMREKGKGSIVFISSNSALRVTEDRCAYCASKSAILAMSKSFAVDWGKYGIRSNCVLAGMIKTQRWEDNLNNIKQCLANYTPIGDIADFTDIADAVWYFGNDCSKNTTGAELVVDGGMLAQLVPNISRGLFKNES